MSVIHVQDLAKSYGRITALRGVSLSVEKGEIYGLLGRNGAGKSTLVKILLSIVKVSSGTAELMGRSVPDAASRTRVGYLPEDHQFPEYHTAQSALEFYGSLQGVGREERRKRIPELLEGMELTEAANRKIRTYSKGMKQRLGLAQAMLHDPDVLFLDEPTDGVDPVGRRRIRDYLAEFKKKGRTIFLNSHLLSEVELVCDRVGILDQGKLVREGTVESFTRTENVYEIRTEGPIDAAWDELLKLAPGAKRTGPNLELSLADLGKIDAVVDLLRAKGVSLRGLTEKHSSLEQAFLDELEKPSEA